MSISRLGGLSLLVVALGWAGGCRQSIRLPDIGGIYDNAAMHVDSARNPVVVIPGILGSRIEDEESGKVIWGAFGGDGFADPATPEGLRLVALAMEEGVPLADLPGVGVASRSLDRVQVNLFGLPLKLRAYAHILGTLGVGGYRDDQILDLDYGDDHFTCFQFSYDWRRSNVENAKRLHEFLEEKRVAVAEERRKRFGMEGEVKFDIVAHSMGGLVSRYFARYGSQPLVDENGDPPQLNWAGTEYIDKLIMVGTPNGGSAHSALQLVEGFQLASLLPRYSSAILGSYPAIYELLPRPRHARVLDNHGQPLDILDPVLWQDMRWGLADPREDEALKVLLPDVKSASERREIALDHQAKCLENARLFFAALDRPVERPKGYQPILFAGDAVPTAGTLQVHRGKRTIRVQTNEPGDGTVTRANAVLDERQGKPWTPGLQTPIPWTQVRLLFTDHLGMTKDPAFVDNVLFLLLEDFRRE